MSSFTAPASPEAPKPTSDSPKDKPLFTKVYEGVQKFFGGGAEFLKKATLEQIKISHNREITEMGNMENSGSTTDLYRKAKELIERRLEMYKGFTYIEGAQEEILRQIDEIQRLSSNAVVRFDKQNVPSDQVQAFEKDILGPAKSKLEGAKGRLAGKEGDAAAVKQHNSLLEGETVHLLGEVQKLGDGPVDVVKRGKAVTLFRELRADIKPIPVEAPKPKSDGKENKDMEIIENKMNRLKEALDAATKELQKKKELTSVSIREVAAKVDAAREDGEPNPTDDQIKGAFTSELPPDSILVYEEKGEMKLNVKALTLEKHEKDAVAVLKNEKATDAEKKKARETLDNEYKTAVRVKVGGHFIVALQKEFGDSHSVTLDGEKLKIEPKKGSESAGSKPPESGEMPKTMEEWMKKILEIIQQIFRMLQGIEGKIGSGEAVPVTKEDAAIKNLKDRVSANNRTIEELRKKDPKHPDIVKLQQENKRLEQAITQLQGQKQEVGSRVQKVRDDVRKAAPGADAYVDGQGRLILRIEESDDGTYRKISARLQGRMTRAAAQRFGNRLEHGKDGRIQFPLSPDETIYALGLQPVVINNFNYGNQQIGGRNVMNFGKEQPRPKLAQAPSRPEPIPASAPSKPEVKPAPAKPEVKPPAPKKNIGDSMQGGKPLQTGSNGGADL